LAKPVSSTIHASIWPCASIAGRTSPRTSAKTASSDHAACADRSCEGALTVAGGISEPFIRHRNADAVPFRCKIACNNGSDAYVEWPDRQGFSRALNRRRTVRSYVRPCDADFPLAMMNSATSASLITFARSMAP
jgi:hypothetical protein